MSVPPDAVASRSPVTDSDRAAFGEFLQRARHASGLSLTQIAEQTKVCSRYLDAIERGQIEVLPEGLYQRAILRAYATAINLDANIALERFAVTFGPKVRDHNGEGLPPRVSQNSEQTRPKLSAAAMITAGVTLGTVVILALAAREDTQEPQRIATPAAPLPVLVESNATTALKEVTLATSGGAPVETVPSLPGGLTVISSPPGARVTVDGVGWGITPLTVQYLPPGVKLVRATKDGYLSVERRVSLNGASGPTEIHLELLPGN